MNEELLPCAHCGGHSELSGEFSQHYMILCTDCGIRTEFFHTIAKAVESWNKRVEEKVTVEIHHILTDAPKAKIKPVG